MVGLSRGPTRLIVEPNRIWESTRPRVLGWMTGKKPFHAPMPARSILCFGRAGGGSTLTPSASITPIAPQFDDTARAACRPTVRPHADVTMAAPVLTLNVFK